MKFLHQWRRSNDGTKIEFDNIGEVIEFHIRTTDSERGQLEDLEAKLGELVKLVAKMAESLHPEQQAVIAQQCGCKTEAS